MNHALLPRNELRRFVEHRLAYLGLSQREFCASATNASSALELSQSTLSRLLHSRTIPEDYFDTFAEVLECPVEMFHLLHFIDRIPNSWSGGMPAETGVSLRTFEMALTAWHFMAQFGSHLLLEGEVMLKAVDLLSSSGLAGKRVYLCGLDPLGADGRNVVNGPLDQRERGRWGRRETAGVLFAKFTAATMSFLSALDRDPPDEAVWWLHGNGVVPSPGSRSSYTLANEHVALRQVPIPGVDCTEYPLEVTYAGSAEWEQEIRPLFEMRGDRSASGAARIFIDFNSERGLHCPTLNDTMVAASTAVRWDVLLDALDGGADH